jgi:hypothetical protein
MGSRNRFKTKDSSTKKKPKLEPHQQEAARRQAAFKANRGKSIGEKSFNKGKPKSEWVKTAYDRRQADAKASTAKAAKKSHEQWMKDNKRGKYSDRAIKKSKEKENKRHGIKEGDNALTRFVKKGGVAGSINRALKKQRLKVKERAANNPTSRTRNRRGSGARNRR